MCPMSASAAKKTANSELADPIGLGYAGIMITSGKLQLGHPGFLMLGARFAVASLLAALAAPAQAASNLMITNVQNLRLAVQSHERQRCHLDLNAEVCAVDMAAGLVALRDASGVEVCEWEFDFPRVFAGEHLQLALADCELIRRPGAVAVAPPPLVDLGGVHSAQQKSGLIHLTAGLQPIHLFYFNAKNPAELKGILSVPGFTNQPVPTRSLFIDPADTSAQAGERPGLQYFCYNDTPATLDEARHEKPSASGIATNFDISQRVPEEFVAMQFRGDLAVPETGDYVFTVISDDGSELYVGGLRPQVEVLASNTPPAAGRPAFWSEAAMPDAGEWTTIAGRVSFAGFAADGLDLDVVVGDHVIRLWVPNPRELCSSLLLNAEVAVTGVLHPFIGPGGQKLFGLMSVIGSQNIRVRELAADQWDKYPLMPVTKVVSGAPGTFIAHLSGRVSQIQADGRFVLSDGPASVTVIPGGLAQITNGATVEVLGNRIGHGKQAEIEAAVYRPLPLSPGVLPMLTTAASISACFP